MIYWISGFGFSAAIILVGLLSRTEDCDHEPGPCYFNYISHWYYIWYCAMFFLWGLCRHFAVARFLATMLQWFNFGSVWVWSVMTTLLIITTKKDVFNSLLDTTNNSQLGFYVLVLLWLHYWPLFAMLWFTSQWGEYIAAKWARMISWTTAHLTALCSVTLVSVMLWSPILFWIIYLSIYNPFDVYKVDPKFAASYLVPFIIALATILFSGFALGLYLDQAVCQLIARRVEDYGQAYFHTHPEHVKRQAQQPASYRVVAKASYNNNTNTATITHTPASAPASTESSTGRR